MAEIEITAELLRQMELESITTDISVKKLGEKYGVELPLTNAVYQLCYAEEEGSYRQRCDKLMQQLFARETKTEF